jgi:F-type H+-transporting ATPase subunit epsilon
MMKKLFFAQADSLKYNLTLVTFLSDRAERAESMDEAEAIKAQELAEKNMHDKESDLDYTKAAAQLAEAAARIKTIQKLRKNK